MAHHMIGHRHRPTGCRLQVAGRPAEVRYVIAPSLTSSPLMSRHSLWKGLIFFIATSWGRDNIVISGAYGHEVTSQRRYFGGCRLALRWPYGEGCQLLLAGTIYGRSECHALAIAAD